MKFARLIIPLILILILIVIVVGAIVFRDKLSGRASDLKVGDCFEVPAGDTVGDVQHRLCTEPHDGEVLVVGDYPTATTYPTTSQFDDWVKTQCVDTAFQAYVGDTYDARTDVSVAYFYPQSDGWNKGDHGMICYLTPATSGTKVSVSFHNSGAASAAPSASTAP